MHLPTHVGFLIDGNRRWARKNNKTEAQGYDAGADNVYEIAKACIARGIRFVTFWGLSSENFKNRTPKELEYIFNAIKKTGLSIEKMKEYKAGLRVIGNVAELPKIGRDFIAQHVQPYAKEENLDAVVVAGVNYGGRDEMIRAMKRMVSDSVPEDKISDEVFARYLDTAGMPDPELIVRTGGEKRLSGFMPWQSIYSELYFSDILWPDFKVADLDEAFAWFSSVKRNFGK